MPWSVCVSVYTLFKKVDCNRGNPIEEALPLTEKEVYSCSSADIDRTSDVSQVGRRSNRTQSTVHTVLVHEYCSELRRTVQFKIMWFQLRIFRMTEHCSPAIDSFPKRMMILYIHTLCCPHRLFGPGQSRHLAVDALNRHTPYPYPKEAATGAHWYCINDVSSALRRRSHMQDCMS